MKRAKEENRFIVSVKVGPKGQITIPVEARKMFDIEIGDTLMILGDKKRGLAIMKDDAFYALMGGMDSNGRDQNQ
ncbi:MAG: AbrB/MazE/SpoVT family DNA-binding domain-containing protein [Clostridia bacterium]|nr:AbrB/MazE/SpoVT family DNA-binding domain-containing protein [Clostridia bacterium]